MKPKNRYLIETGGQTWVGEGEDMNKGVIDAFNKIRDACYEENSNTMIDKTFTVRRQNEPRKKAIEGKSLSMLIEIGELSAEEVCKLLSTIGDTNGT